jgi:DnaB-like helicase C terminal domain
MNILDSPDFIEVLIKHLVRDKAIFNKAKELKIRVDDFGDPLTGNRIYREFASIILSINDSPISLDILTAHIVSKLDQDKLSSSDQEQLFEFINHIYDGELNTEYILNELPNFIKRKRLLRLQLKHKDDIDALAQEYNKLVVDLKTVEATESVHVINPFESPIFKSSVNVIPTGLTRIDTIIQGQGYQEFSLWLGASGGGKSTIATVLTKNAAAAGFKVLYLSLEEPAVNITQRMYANVLRIPYSNLHRGMANDLLAQKLLDLDPDLKAALINNLRIVDLRDQTPLAPAILTNWVENWCTENNFYPDLIIGDQLEFFTSDQSFKVEWEMLQQIMLQLDRFSQYKIGGFKEFHFALLHQLTDMRLNYSTKEIAGFKGATRKCDLVTAIGRKNQTDPSMNLHSLKARHSPNFKFEYRANFEFMDISDYIAPTFLGKNKMFKQDETSVITPSILPPPPI